MAETTRGGTGSCLCGEVALQFEFTWLANESCLSEMLRDRRFPPAIGNKIRRDVHSQTQSKRVHW